MIGRPPRSTLFPSTTLSRSLDRFHRPRLGHHPPRPGGRAVDRDVRGALLGVLEEQEALVEHAAVGLDQRRSEEHTSELQSRQYLVCRLLLEKKKNNLSLNHH